MARLDAAIASHVPGGYEDETGFHFQSGNGAGSFQFNHSTAPWETPTI
jgi:hypothetical protein